jgi:predicted AAA+ superfamily ATPase
LPEIQLVATGSSSFDLANKIDEPLTGRKREYKLFPVSFKEMAHQNGLLEELRVIPSRLVFGYYPEVITSTGNEKEVLKEIMEGYLYKDILSFDRIRKSDKLIKLLRTLAFQIGSEVSYSELGKIAGLDNETVENYIQILEKAYIIFRLGAFSRNLRKELTRSRKIYFYDNGNRNSLIADFSLPEIRQDIGVLWENFVISERKKYLHYNNIWVNCYFWRTSDQQEIDFIEECDGKLNAYEIKWNPHRKAHLPLTFARAYPDHSFDVITKENFERFLIM